MQVTCPNCGARYAVDPLAIGPTGRTVECARCHHRWRERMVGQDPSLTAAPPASPGPLPEPRPDPRTEPRFGPPPAAPSLPPIGSPRPVPDFVMRPPSPYKSGLPALTTPTPRSHWALWLAGTAAVAAILLIGAAYAWRAEILIHLPDDWRAMLGLDAMPGVLRQ